MPSGVHTTGPGRSCHKRRPTPLLCSCAAHRGEILKADTVQDEYRTEYTATGLKASHTFDEIRAREDFCRASVGSRSGLCGLDHVV